MPGRTRPVTALRILSITSAATSMLSRFTDFLTADGENPGATGKQEFAGRRHQSRVISCVGKRLEHVIYRIGQFTARRFVAHHLYPQRRPDRARSHSAPTCTLSASCRQILCIRQRRLWAMTFGRCLLHEGPLSSLIKTGSAVGENQKALHRWHEVITAQSGRWWFCARQAPPVFQTIQST